MSKGPCSPCSDHFLPHPSEREGSSYLGLTLHEVAREWRSLIDAQLKQHSMSSSRWLVLKSLKMFDKPSSQKEIADFIGIEGPSLVRTLDSLEQDGWVRRDVSEQDRRVKLVSLLPKADEFLAGISEICFNVGNEVMADFPEDELNKCHQTLLRIRARVLELNGKDDTGS